MITHIRCIDLETTGLSAPEHAPVEIGWCDLRLKTSWHLQGGLGTLVNPGRPIPPEASAVHHIVDDDVRDAGAWAETLAALVDPIPEVFAAHNAKFERQWITDEMIRGRPWICTYKCALRLWPDAPGHSVQTLRYWRKPAGLDRRIADVSHRAWPDAYVTAHLLRDMVSAAPVEDLIRWSSEPALLPRCLLGKFRNDGKGTPWSQVDDGFLNWILGRSDFDEDTVHTVKTELARRAAEWEAKRQARNSSLAQFGRGDAS